MDEKFKKTIILTQVPAGMMAKTRNPDFNGKLKKKLSWDESDFDERITFGVKKRNGKDRNFGRRRRRWSLVADGGERGHVICNLVDSGRWTVSSDKITSGRTTVVRLSVFGGFYGGRVEVLTIVNIGVILRIKIIVGSNSRF